MKSFKEFMTESDNFSLTKHVEDYIQKHRHITATVDNRYGDHERVLQSNEQERSL